MEDDFVSKEEWEEKSEYYRGVGEDEEIRKKLKGRNYDLRSTFFDWCKLKHYQGKMCQTNEVLDEYFSFNEKR